jgi:hypothetical protein
LTDVSCCCFKETFAEPLSVVARLSLVGVGLGLGAVDRTAVLDESEVRVGLIGVSSFVLLNVNERLDLISFFDVSIIFSFFVSDNGWDSILSLKETNDQKPDFLFAIFYRVFCSSCTADDKSLRSKILLLVI